MNLNSSWGYALNKIGQELNAQFSEKLEPFSINARDYGIMLFVKEHPAISQKEIGEAMKVDRTTMVQLIDNLEEKGFLKRTNNPKDRRSYSITLTEQGERILKKMWNIMREIEKEVIENLSEAYLLTFDEVIKFIKTKER